MTDVATGAATSGSESVTGSVSALGPSFEPASVLAAAPLARRLARFALGLPRSHLTGARQTKLSLIVADFIGCVLGGSGLPEAASALVLARPGHVAVPGLAERLTPDSAAIAMGCLGSLLQLHDGFGRGGNHPSNSIIPAVWCSRTDQTMAEVQMAVAVGYEVANRIAESSHPQLTLQGLAPTSATGAIGATAALGRLLGLNETVVSHAISNAAFSFPVAALRGLTEHGSAVPLHGGLAARCAMESIALAQAGLSAGDTVLEGGDDPGVLSVMQSRWQTLAPETWRGETLDGIYFKPIPACRHAQPAVDAVQAIWQHGPVSSESIRSILIRTYPVGLRFGQAPGASCELYDRIMSTTWVVASALRHRRYDIDNVLAPLEDPEIARLCGVTQVVVDDNYAALYPRFLVTRVDLELADGSVRSGLCPMEYGTPSEAGPYSPLGTHVPPLDAQGVQDKFLALARRVLDDSAAQAMWHEIIDQDPVQSPVL